MVVLFRRSETSVALRICAFTLLPYGSITLRVKKTELKIQFKQWGIRNWLKNLTEKMNYCNAVSNKARDPAEGNRTSSIQTIKHYADLMY